MAARESAVVEQGAEGGGRGSRKELSWSDHNCCLCHPALLKGAEGKEELEMTE